MGYIQYYSVNVDVQDVSERAPQAMISENGFHGVIKYPSHKPIFVKSNKMHKEHLKVIDENPGLSGPEKEAYKFCHNALCIKEQE